MLCPPLEFRKAIQTCLGPGLNTFPPLTQRNSLGCLESLRALDALVGVCLCIQQQAGSGERGSSAAGNEQQRSGEACRGQGAQGGVVVRQASKHGAVEGLRFEGFES